MTLLFFNDAGIQVRALDGGPSDHAVTGLAFSSNPFDPSQGPEIISNGDWSASFDGLARDGSTLANGEYRVEALSSGGGGAAVQATLTVLASGGAGINRVLVSSNPVEPGTDNLFITWAPMEPVEIRVYNLEGELVADKGLVGTGGGGMSWDLRGSDGRVVSDGIYLVVLRPPGAAREKVFKLAVAR